MERSEQSNSFEQQMAEQIIFEKVQNWLNKNLKENAKILVGKTYMQPDFYSKEDGIIGEIFAHIGNDILKMLLLEKLEKRTYRKIIVVCDEQEMKKITGTSVLAECIRQFDIEVKMINIETDLRTMLIAAQKRQRMINA